MTCTIMSELYKTSNISKPLITLDMVDIFAKLFWSHGIPSLSLATSISG